MTAIARSLFSLTTLVLSLAANACAVSGTHPAESAAIARSCPGGRIESADQAARFAGCRQVEGDLTIAAPELADLSALSELREVSGTLEISGNSQLDDLSGLERLRKVGRLSIHDNAELDDLNGLQQLRAARQVLIGNNPELTTLRGLSSLTHLEKLVLDHNGLYQAAGLSSLSEVGQLIIENNRALNSLQGLRALRHASSVEIRNNPRLCARGMLPALTQVDRELTLSDNRGLSRPDVRELLGRVEHGAPSTPGDGVAQLDAALR